MNAYHQKSCKHYLFPQLGGKGGSRINVKVKAPLRGWENLCFFFASANPESSNVLPLLI